jgi:hypothetical protein
MVKECSFQHMICFFAVNRRVYIFFIQITKFELVLGRVGTVLGPWRLKKLISDFLYIGFIIVCAIDAEITFRLLTET